MKLYFLKTITYVFWLSLFGCANKNETVKDNKLQMTNSNYRKLNYDSIILIVAHASENFETSQGLVLIDEFKELYENSIYYVDDAINFLAKDSATLQQKKITIYAMQNLDLNNYLKICNACKSLYDQNKIPELILKTAISANFLKKYPIISNYDNEEVEAFLKLVISDPKVPDDLKGQVGEILSGKSWREVKRFLKNS